MTELIWLKNKPITGLAPMAGWTDSPFRQICKNFGADLLFSEMIPATGIIHFGSKKKSEFRSQKSAQNFFNTLYFTKKERPFAMQIFGKRPDEMAEACRILNEGEINLNQKEVRNQKSEVNSSLERRRFIIRLDEININFGCPAKTAVKSGHGAALMDNPDLAAAIVRKCVESQAIPITVKMRTGWHSADEAVPFAQKMAQAGAQAIYIHGRTFKQKYLGLADWQKIYQVAQSVAVPVVGNGDIMNQEEKRKKIEESSGLLAGVLIGRAARGNPWIFSREIANKKSEERSQKSARKDFRETILKHAELMFNLKGEHGIIEFRKHLLQYVSGFLGAARLRQKLVRVETIEQINQLLNTLA